MPLLLFSLSSSLDLIEEKLFILKAKVADSQKIFDEMGDSNEDLKEQILHISQARNYC